MDDLQDLKQQPDRIEAKLDKLLAQDEIKKHVADELKRASSRREPWA